MDDVRAVMDATGSERAAIFSAVAGSLVETLREGARVEFDVVEGPKGPQAADRQAGFVIASLLQCLG